MSSHLIFFNMLLRNNFKRKKRKSEIMKKAVVFYIICDFVDSDVLYELKYVCRKFMQLILLKEKLENKTLKIQIKRIKNKIVLYIY